MKRLWLACVALIGVSAAVVLSRGTSGVGAIFFPTEERNPVTHLRWRDDPAEFQFAIVSDRTGGHRADVFSQAVEKLNLLQPEFVVSVGDLIEGGKQPREKLAAEWQEFDGFVHKLNMPFFYVPGNHDTGAKETASFWKEKFNRSYYHFVYRNVLFLILDSDDPPGGNGSVGKEQIRYAQKTLRDNAHVNWTVVVIHRPLWTVKNGSANGWSEVEAALQGRPYTVFTGHVHRYEKYVRHGMNYYQLATTGGVSLMRGVDYNEFDHVVWVTMKKDGPLLANILLDSIQTENLQKIKTSEPDRSTANRLPTQPVIGRIYFEGVPTPGAVVTLVSEKGPRASGHVEADGSFKLTTYRAFDGIPEGNYRASVTWRDPGNRSISLLPARFADPMTSGLRAAIKAGTNDIVLELHK